MSSVPTRRLFHCEPIFKKGLCNHNRCHTSKEPSMVKGWKLNQFVGKTDLLQDAEKYRVCSTIHDQIKIFKFSPQSTSLKRQRQPSSIDSTCTLRMTRSHKRNRERNDTIETIVKKTKKVKLSYLNDENREEYVEIALNTRRSSKQKTIDDIMRIATTIKKPYKNLVMNERRKRMEDMANRILACCVDKSLLKILGLIL